MIPKRNRNSHRINVEPRRTLLNRSALVVKPKEPFLGWLHEADPTSHGLALEDLVREPSVYLIPECETGEAVREVLRELCDEIFIEQLDGWYRDQATWPKERGFDVFSRWFDFEHHSMLIDLCGEPLLRVR